MKSLKAILIASLVGCTIFVGTGCGADKSGETQQMPTSASAPNKSPTNPNLPPQAQKAIGQAAPPSTDQGK